MKTHLQAVVSCRGRRCRLWLLWKNPQLTQKIRAALNSNSAVEATGGL
ncbi:MAG: hypothetical protein ACLU99_08695 [Alphaproteobacteria bacterium]